MNFLELAKERFSLRKFDTKPVEKEKLELILEAARVAPTAVNYQPQRILVVDSPEEIEKVKKATTYQFGAPITLVVCYDKGISWKNPFSGVDAGPEDVAICMTHMMLQAVELGLGTTYVGYFDPKVIIVEFNLPDYLVPVALLPLGYAKEDARISKLHYLRNEQEKFVFYNSFDGIEEGKREGFTHK